MSVSSDLSSLGKRWRNLIAGGAVSLTLVLATALFSFWPNWQSMAPDAALMRLSFAASGGRECRDRTAGELAKLPPNMRSAQLCGRRRAPVYVEMDLNGKRYLARELMPSGLSGSGPSRIYQRFELAAGTYDVALRLRIDPTQEGFSATAERRVTLAPGQSMAIDYDAEAGGFVFR
jgi:hypothetical protein